MAGRPNEISDHAEDPKESGIENVLLADTTGDKTSPAVQYAQAVALWGDPTKPEGRKWLPGPKSGEAYTEHINQFAATVAKMSPEQCVAKSDEVVKHALITQGALNHIGDKLTRLAPYV